MVGEEGKMLAWLARRWSVLLAVVAAGTVVALYVARTAQVASGFGFPLDDAYIYMTYARQMARAAPFTYFEGGGFSAGATSVLWPALLAPLWGLGLRGALFIYGVLAVSAALLAATAALAAILATRITGRASSAVLPVALVLACGPVSCGYLSGMEAPLAATLILAVAARLIHEGEAPPSTLLLVLLAATALARPEAGLLVAAICGVKALKALRRPALAARWLVPLAPVAALAIATRLLAGHFTPNTAVAKAHFYLPGFEWGYWLEIVRREGERLLRAVFWEHRAGFVTAPRLVLFLWLVGAARLVAWGWRERRLAGALTLVAAPWAIFAAVLAASGQWAFQNHRYIVAGLPALFSVCGLALAPPARWPRVAALIPAVVAAGYLWVARGDVELNLRIHAQSARDINAQAVVVGKWIDANLPADAHVAVHDVGAVGYFGNRRITDIIGLVTNHQAHVCNHGPGARFEGLERLAPEDRPTHFAYYPGWLLTGSRDLFGRTLFSATVPPRVYDKSFVGGTTMSVMESRWELLGSGDAPREGGGWRVVDAVDVADLESERAHAWAGDLGARPRLDTPTAHWSVYLSADGVADGGRMIRGGRERFILDVDPSRPVRLVLRAGGPRDMPGSKLRAEPRTLLVRAAGVERKLALPPPGPGFVETSAELPASGPHLVVEVVADEPYRVYHWWALQDATEFRPDALAR